MPLSQTISAKRGRAWRARPGVRERERSRDAMRYARSRGADLDGMAAASLRVMDKTPSWNQQVRIEADARCGWGSWHSCLHPGYWDHMPLRPREMRGGMSR